MNAHSIIGLDASRSTIEQPTGTELYSRLLIEALLERAPDQFSFRLYFNQPPRSQIFNSRTEARYLPFPRLWTHGRLSLEMTLHPPSVLFVPAHVLPVIQPRRSVVTVHDLGYLYFPETHPLRQRLYLEASTWFSARRAQAVIADSRSCAADLQRFYGVPAGRITVAYPGPILAPMPPSDEGAADRKSVV